MKKIHDFVIPKSWAKFPSSGTYIAFLGFTDDANRELSSAVNPSYRKFALYYSILGWKIIGASMIHSTCVYVVLTNLLCLCHLLLTYLCFSCLHVKSSLCSILLNHTTHFCWSALSFMFVGKYLWGFHFYLYLRAQHQHQWSLASTTTWFNGCAKEAVLCQTGGSGMSMVISTSVWDGLRANWRL